MMQKYRKKPVVIEAIQFDGTREQAAKIKSLCFKSAMVIVPYDATRIEIHIRTLEGTMAAKKGDWIIKGIADEFYPCRDDIFHKTYELVEK